MLRLVAGTKYEVLRYISTEIKIDFTNSGKKNADSNAFETRLCVSNAFFEEKKRVLIDFSKIIYKIIFFVNLNNFDLF
jgi:hypothetical protein